MSEQLPETTEEFPESGKSETTAEDQEKYASVQSEDTSAGGINDEAEGDQGDNGPGSDTDDDAETFPKSYVQKLRDENARYRQRAQRSDELAHRLHRALVAADGRLADPTDLEFDDGHLEDSEVLTAAVDELLRTKPHLAARKPAGDIGQGASGGNSTVDLAGLLRAGAN